MKRLELLDYARFFAALWVMAFHYTFNGILNGKIQSISHIEPLIQITKYGYLGVELFFMISGYVIFFSAQNKSAAEFAMYRAIRLMPCYWLAVIFTSIVMLAWGSYFGDISYIQILVNLTMLQSFLGFSHIDGVYWTLVYEITFYFAVFLILFVGLGRYLTPLFIAWPFIMLAGLLLGLEKYPYMGEYFAYFSAGALFALYKSTRSKFIFIPILVAAYLCISFSLSQTEIMQRTKQILFYSPIMIGVISSFFLFFLLLNSNRGGLLKLPGSKILGALTYPVYLIHAHIGYIFINNFANNDNKIFIYLLTATLIISIAFIMHWVLEIRLFLLWKTFFTFTIKKPVDLALNGISLAHKFSRGRP